MKEYYNDYRLNNETEEVQLEAVKNYGHLIKYIFNPSDSITFNDVKTELTTQINKYVPSVEFRDVSIYNSETEEGGIIVMVEYGVKRGNKTEITTVAVKL